MSLVDAHNAVRALNVRWNSHLAFAQGGAMVCQPPRVTQFATEFPRLVSFPCAAQAGTPLIPSPLTHVLYGSALMLELIEVIAAGSIAATFVSDFLSRLMKTLAHMRRNDAHAH